VIANSARVEVWLIDEETLNLLPATAKNVVLTRLKRKQQVQVHGSKQLASDKAKTTLLKQVEARSSQEQELIRN
jgi:hypothetical protein